MKTILLMMGPHRKWPAVTWGQRPLRQEQPVKQWVNFNTLTTYQHARLPSITSQGQTGFIIGRHGFFVWNIVQRETAEIYPDLNPMCTFQVFGTPARPVCPTDWFSQVDHHSFCYNGPLDWHSLFNFYYLDFITNRTYRTGGPGKRKTRGKEKKLKICSITCWEKETAQQGNHSTNQHEHQLQWAINIQCYWAAYRANNAWYV